MIVGHLRWIRAHPFDLYFLNIVSKSFKHRVKKLTQIQLLLKKKVKPFIQNVVFTDVKYCLVTVYKNEL